VAKEKKVLLKFKNDIVEAIPRMNGVFEVNGRLVKFKQKYEVIPTRGSQEEKDNNDD